MDTINMLPNLIDPETLDGLLQRQAPLKIVDVRTPAEFASAHIPGSYNVPLDLLSEHQVELRDSLRAPVVLVCRSGMRARQAEQLLRASALDHVRVLEGGISAWDAASKPLKRGRSRWGLERQVRGAAGSLVLLGALGGLLLWKPLILLAAFVGAGLTYSALTDTCGMALLLSKLPYNQGPSCDMREVVRQLTGAEGQGTQTGSI